MITIGLLGDTHGDLGWMAYAVGKFQREGIKTVLQVGDFGVWPSERSQLDFDKINDLLVAADQCWFVVPGNHEDYNQINAIPVEKDGWQKFRSHISLAPRGHSWEWGGMDFLAFGGAGSPDRSNRRQDFSWWAGEEQSYAEIQRALDRGLVDVLVTHDAPEGIKAIDRRISSNPFGFAAHDLAYCNQVRKNTSAVFASADPLWLFHGHFHFAYQELFNDALVTGLSLNNDLHGSLGSFDLETKEIELWDLTEDFREYYGGIR